jgi:hypothetical protein
MVENMLLASVCYHAHLCTEYDYQLFIRARKQT